MEHNPGTMPVTTQARAAMAERVMELIAERRYGSIAAFRPDGSGGTLYATDVRYVGGAFAGKVVVRIPCPDGDAEEAAVEAVDAACERYAEAVADEAQ